MGVWDGGACARDGGAVKGDAVGLVGRGGVEGVLAQVLESGVGVEVALAVSVVAVGDVVGVAGLGACALGDGFACGGGAFGVCAVLVGAVGFGSCGVEGCGADRDTRWVFCYSKGWGMGMLKMADFRPLSHAVGEGGRR